MEIKHLCKLIDIRKDELFNLLCKLIQINSESFATSGNEEACAKYIYEICKEIGLDSAVYSPVDLDGFEEHPDYWPGCNLENRYNVTACWKGAEDRNELMLMGHIDTVEIGDVSNWDFEPLAGVIKIENEK